MDSQYYANLAKQLEKSYGSLEKFYLEKNSGKSNTIQAKLEDLRQKQEAQKQAQEEQQILNLNNPNEGLEQIPSIGQLTAEAEQQKKDLEDDPLTIRGNYNKIKGQSFKGLYLKNKLKELYGDDMKGFPSIGTQMGELILQNVDNPEELIQIQEYMKSLRAGRTIDDYRNRYVPDMVRLREARRRGAQEQKRGEGLNSNRQNALMLLASYLNGNDNPYLKNELKKLLKKI